MRIISIFLLLLIAVFASPAQGTFSTDVRLDRTKPSAFISYEGFSQETLKSSHADRKVLLRLRNNSVWNLIVDTVSCRTIKEECGVFYKVHRRDGEIAPKSELPYCHVCAAKSIPPKESILFSIPVKFLSADLFIKVNFNYEWEGMMGGSGRLDNIHSVSFFGYTLPKEPTK